MAELEERLKEIALKLPEIYLPSNKNEMEKWAVVACDQYSSNKEYWHDVEKITEGSPSTLNLIFPECYLDEPDAEKRIREIKRTMTEYLEKGILTKNDPSFFLVERKTASGSVRHGLIAALDLEAYDYSKGSKSLIRATEGTIEERIPPRKKIREGAPLELPHILVLIDDPHKTVIEPLITRKNSFESMYDFDLMKNGGHIRGFRVDRREDIESIVSGFEKLADRETFKKQYGSTDVLLYAMGDGNHSLATAKAVWEEIKAAATSTSEIMNHPSRWALVEIENIHDEGIVFEPIHRVLFHCTSELFFRTLKELENITYKEVPSLNEIMASLSTQASTQRIGFCDSHTTGIIEIEAPSSTIAAGSLQKVIDTLIAENNNVEVDYIHGDEETYKLGRKEGNIGLFLPAISKKTFFRTIVQDKTFPRKTFSMGEADEKRYYIECRKIIP